MAGDVLEMAIPKEEQEEIKRIYFYIISSSERGQGSSVVKCKCFSGKKETLRKQRGKKKI